MLGAAHVAIDATTPAQRALMTADQLFRRNVEIQLRLEQLDLDLLDDDVDYDEQEDLLEESDEIEALLQDKFAVTGGGRVWIQPAVAEAAKVARRLATEAHAIIQPSSSSSSSGSVHVLEPRSNKQQRTSSWVQKLNEAAAARTPPDAVWTRGVLAQASHEYDAIEAAGRRRAQKRRRRASAPPPSATQAVDDYTWRLGQIWIRLPSDCPIEPGSVRVDLGPRRLILESGLAQVQYGGSDEFGVARPLGALHVLCGAGLAQVDTVIEATAATDARLLRVAIVVRRGLWSWPVIRQSVVRRALRTVLICCEDAGTYELDEFAVAPSADPASLTVAWLYDALVPAAFAPIVAIPDPIRTCPSRYQLAAAAWMIDRERDPIVRHPDPAWSRYEISAPDDVEQDDGAGDAILYDVVRGRFMAGHRPVPEVEIPRGGILADQMGLGKTLECLIVIAANRRDPIECGNYVSCNDGTHRSASHCSLKVSKFFQISIYFFLSLCLTMLSQDVVRHDLGRRSAQFGIAMVA
jgi:hypothetical protein